MDSLPRITPRDKQRGVFLTCPDCVTMAANMAEHVRLLAATMQHVERHIREKPEILSYGQVSVSFLTKSVVEEVLLTVT